MVLSASCSLIMLYPVTAASPMAFVESLLQLSAVSVSGVKHLELEINVKLMRKLVEC